MSEFTCRVNNTESSTFPDFLCEPRAWAKSNLNFSEFYTPNLIMFDFDLLSRNYNFFINWNFYTCILWCFGGLSDLVIDNFEF